MENRIYILDSLIMRFYGRPKNGGSLIRAFLLCRIAYLCHLNMTHRKIEPDGSVWAGISMKQFVRECGMTRQNITEHLEKLCEAGAIEKRYECGKRKTFYRPTDPFVLAIYELPGAPEGYKNIRHSETNKQKRGSSGSLSESAGARK